MDRDGIEIGTTRTSGLTVRLEALTLSDKETSADLETLAAAMAGMSPWSHYPMSAAALRRYLTAQEPGAPRYGLRVGGVLAGAVGVRLAWLRGPYLQMLAVTPDFQAQGLGRLVLGWMEREARLAGERNLWVCASDFNAAALHFYEAHGFHRVASLDGLVVEHVAEILLRKRLDSAPGA